MREWIKYSLKSPKGFENFYPKKRKSNNKSTEKSLGKEEKEMDIIDNESHSTNEQENALHSTNGNDSVGSHKEGSSSNGNGTKWNSNAGRNQAFILMAILLTIFVFIYFLDEETKKNGREITWAEFYNQILYPGNVDHILVINKKIARIYLHQDVPGIHDRKDKTSEVKLQPTSPEVNSSMLYNSSYDDVPSQTSDKLMNFDIDTKGTELNCFSDSSFNKIPEDKNVNEYSHQNQRANHQLVYHFNIGSVESFEEKLSRSQRDLHIPVRDYVPIYYATETNWLLELIKMSPILLIIAATAYMISGLGRMKGGTRGGIGSIFQIGKNNAKKVSKEDVNITFADVAGSDEAKKEIMEFVEFLKDPTRFKRIGAKIPKGALLHGPPGTGKTLLAKAIAGEAGVPFYCISGSDFIEMFVGVGSSRVRDLFKEARANSPCIVFIDEIDAVGRKRGRGGFSGGNDERENTLNQLLVEMDGFTPSSGVVVIAGTNRVDILDEALTRPGRFDRQIQVDRPDLYGRKEIFMVHLKGIKLETPPDDIVGRLAALTPGFAGADIANMCNEAAIIAARRSGNFVSICDFEKATDRIIGGLESHRIMSKDERNVVAHHEAGHAIAGWFLEHADPILKVTIIPRSNGALGFAQYLPSEVFLRTKDQIMHTVYMSLAGRAAEQVFFGKVTTGASDDLRRVTDLVYKTIKVYGMNSKIGQLSFPQDPSAISFDKLYSDSTAAVMDEEAQRIMNLAYKRTLTLITEKKKDVETVARLLLEKETITHDDILDIVGPCSSKCNDSYDVYMRKPMITNE